jgi:hypothetical protein
MTEKQIIRTARERVGNKIDSTVGESGVPDQAVSAEMRERVIEVARYYGTSQARKEVRFSTVPIPVLSTPTAPTLTAAETDGALVAGSYQYRISATLGPGETLAGPEASVAATISGNTGSVAVAWSPVQYATGYAVYGRTAGTEKLLARVGGTTWTDTGVVLPAVDGLPASNGTGGGFLQDYDVAAYVGADVQEILEVLRSDEYRGENLIQPTLVDPITGVPVARATFVEQGLQQSALDHILTQERFLHLDQFAWEQVYYNDKGYLRLMPPPLHGEVVQVTYLSTTADIEDLPPDARVPLEHAACAALINCILNRVNSAPSAVRERATDQRYWIEMAERQRDYYDNRYQAAIAKRPRQ